MPSFFPHEMKTNPNRQSVANAFFMMISFEVFTKCKRCFLQRKISPRQRGYQVAKGRGFFNGV